MVVLLATGRGSAVACNWLSCSKVGCDRNPELCAGLYICVLNVCILPELCVGLYV